MSRGNRQTRALPGSERWFGDELVDFGTEMNDCMEDFAYEVRNQFEWINDYVADSVGTNKNFQDIIKSPEKPLTILSPRKERIRALVFQGLLKENVDPSENTSMTPSKPKSSSVGEHSPNVSTMSSPIAFIRPTSPSPIRQSKQKSTLTPLTSPLRPDDLHKSPAQQQNVSILGNKPIPTIPQPTGLSNQSPVRQPLGTHKSNLDLRSPSINRNSDHSKENISEFFSVEAKKSPSPSPALSPSPSPRKSITKLQESSHSSFFRIPSEKDFHEDVGHMAEEETSFLAISRNVRNSVLNATEKGRENSEVTRRALESESVKEPESIAQQIEHEGLEDAEDDDAPSSPETTIQFAKLPARQPYTKKSIGRAPSRERSWIDFKPTTAVISATSATIAATVTATAPSEPAIFVPTPVQPVMSIPGSLYPSLNSPSIYPDLFKHDVIESSTPKSSENPEEFAIKQYTKESSEKNGESGHGAFRPITSSTSATSMKSAISANSIQSNEVLHAVNIPIPPSSSTSSATSALSAHLNSNSLSKSPIRTASKGSIFSKHSHKQQAAQDQVGSSLFSVTMGAFKKAKKMFFEHNHDHHEGAYGNDAIKNAVQNNLTHLEESNNSPKVQRSPSKTSPIRSAFKSHHIHSPIRTPSKTKKLDKLTENTERPQPSPSTERISPTKSVEQSPALSRLFAPTFASSSKNTNSPTRPGSRETPAPQSPTKPKSLYPEVPKLFQEKRPGGGISLSTGAPFGSLQATASSNISRARSPINRAKSPIPTSLDPINRARSPMARQFDPINRVRSPILQTRPNPPPHTVEVGMSSIAATSGSPIRSPTRTPSRLGQRSPMHSPVLGSHSHFALNSPTRGGSNLDRAPSVRSVSSTASVSSSTATKGLNIVSAATNKPLLPTSGKPNNLTKQPLRRPVGATTASTIPQGSNRLSNGALNSLNTRPSLSLTTGGIRIPTNPEQTRKLPEKPKQSLSAKPLPKPLRAVGLGDDTGDLFSQKFRVATLKPENDNRPQLLKRNFALEADSAGKLQSSVITAQQQANTAISQFAREPQTVSGNASNKRKSDVAFDSQVEEQRPANKQQRTSSSNLANMAGAPQRNPLAKPIKPIGTSALLKTPGSASKSSLMKNAVLHSASKGGPYVDSVKYSNDKIKFAALGNVSTNGYRSISNPLGNTGSSAFTTPNAAKSAAYSAHMSSQNQFQTPGKMVGYSSAQRQQQSGSRPQQGMMTPAQSQHVVLPEIYSESEDDDEGSVIMDWANSPQLHALLLKQQQIDPDTVFGPIAPLQLEDVFRSTQGVKPGKFRPRSSSANWSGQDKLTQQEIEQYAKEMGYR